MTHLMAMALFAGLVAIVFALVSPMDSPKSKLLLGLRTFGEFMGVGLLLAWLFYFLPW
jgi:hypothetical protein